MLIDLVSLYALFFHGHLEVCLGRGVIILEKGKHITCLFEQHALRESYTLLLLVLHDNERRITDHWDEKE